MNHIDEGRLQALIDQELGPTERTRVESHLGACLPCRRELETLAAAALSLSEALTSMQVLPAQGRGYSVGWPRAAATPRRAWAPLSRAAVLVLGFAAAASATLPGSPVRRWLGELAAPQRTAAVESAPGRPIPAAAAAPAPAEASRETGVSVLPLEGEVRILLRDPSPELRVRAVLSSGTSAWVYGVGDAASARFETGPGRIEVSGARAGEVRIELPGSASSATVVVDGKEYLRKEGDRLQLSVGAESRTATEVNFRVRP